MRRRVVAAGALACAGLVVAGCGGGKSSSSSSASSNTVTVQQSAATNTPPSFLGSFAPESGLGGTIPKKTIGFVNVLGTSASAQACQAEFLKAAKSVGWTVKTADAAGDPAKMAADVNAMVTAHVDAIVNLAIEQAAAQQGLSAAKAAGIPRINMCGAITNNGAPLYDASYAPNDAAVSAVSTRYMIDDLGGKGDIVAQFFSPIDALARRDAVAQAMINQAGMKVVASHQVDFTNPIQDTVNSTLTMLRAHPEAKAVLVDQDFEFPAVVQAVKNANLNVKVYGMYGEDPAYAALRGGGPARAFSQSPAQSSAWTVVDQLIKYFVNKKPIDPLAAYDHPYPVTLVTYKNVPSGSYLDLFPDYGPFYIAQWRAVGYKF